MDPAPPGLCACGTDASGPRWCGLDHHGTGCQSDAPLTPMPHRPGSPHTITVCQRCAARAHWWHTAPRDRHPTYDGSILGRVLLMPDHTRNPIGHKPPYITR